MAGVRPFFKEGKWMGHMVQDRNHEKVEKLSTSRNVKFREVHDHVHNIIFDRDSVEKL